MMDEFVHNIGKKLYSDVVTEKKTVLYANFIIEKFKFNFYNTYFKFGSIIPVDASAFFLSIIIFINDLGKKIIFNQDK